VGADAFTYNAERNRLLAATVAGETITYDAFDEAGFVTSRNGVPIEWTAGGRLASFGEIHTEWDSLGRAMSWDDGAVSRDFSRWGGRVEVESGGQPIAIDLGFAVLGVQTGSWYYRHLDSRGNVQFISDDSGDIVTYMQYSAYCTYAVHGVGNDGVTFAARPELGDIQLMGARVYDCKTGSFLSKDPVFNVMNQYAYTLGNPIWFSDADGRESLYTGWGNLAISTGWWVLSIYLFATAVSAPIVVPSSVIAAAAALALSIAQLFQAIDEFVVENGANYKTVEFGGEPGSGIPSTTAPSPSNGSGSSGSSSSDSSSSSSSSSGSAPSGSDAAGGVASNGKTKFQSGGESGKFGGASNGFSGGAAQFGGTLCGLTGIEAVFILWSLIMAIRISKGAGNWSAVPRAWKGAAIFGAVTIVAAVVQALVQRDPLALGYSLGGIALILTARKQRIGSILERSPRYPEVASEPRSSKRP